MRTIAQRLTICCLLLWCFAGNVMAQTDTPHVIKWNDTIPGTSPLEIYPHYLSHVNTGGTFTLQDATEFDPETCLWYSGPVFNISGSHHNYYFIETVGQTNRYHFLSAPLAGGQDLGFSADLPNSSQLKNPDEIYYFYDWDQDQYGGGVARGHNDNGWWTVHWVSYSKHDQKWLTSADSYYIVDSAAKYREVTIFPHDKAFNWTQSNIGDLESFAMNWDSNPASNGHPLSITVGQYSYTCTPAYTTYNFEGSNYNFQGDQYIGNDAPAPSAPITGDGSAASYTWMILGEGNDYLSFSSVVNSNDTITTGATPTLYYTRENTQGRKTATLTLTMTFGSGDNIATVVRTAIVTVNTPCQNPAQAATPVVNHNDVTVTWYPTATQYKVEWKKASETNWDNAVSAEVGNVTSYTIHDLDQVEYQYRVIAKCGDDYLAPPTNPTGTFTPQAAPDLMIYGSVFGGGRAADVTKKTEVVIVNCDSIGAIYGGNDIAGSAGGSDGSVITLGTSSTTSTIKIGSVYGGGNGYYAYGSNTFAPATAGTSTIAPDEKVYALSQSNQWNDSVWTNTGNVAVSKPTLTKTSITVTNDFVKVDSVFGGAKNAFVTKNKTGDNDVTTTNTLTTINGGILLTVFGGNNVGGTLGTARQKIDVTNTKTDLAVATGTTGLGRTHGIGYLFGGGNMVAGTTTEINITGGQLDTIFGGGNRESVDEAWLTVNCTGNKRISSALDGNDNILSTYGWDGDALYNVHTLFGGNNRADMDGVPYVTLTSGGVGTAYGGGNAGDMLARASATLDDTDVDYGTHMKLESASIIVDNLYGGCQMSNVAYSTWVEIINGHVGTVYGGCNVSGDVGSTRLYPDQPAFTGSGQNQTANPLYQKVKGATYVKVIGGTVYRDVFAGSNGYYHCNDGIRYVAGMNYGDPDDGIPAEYDPNGLYIGLSVPTHNETNVKIQQNAHIKGNVYAGGNLACVGFTDYTIPQDHLNGEGSYPQFVGLSFVEMSGGEVDGDVYGGGRMASVFGSNTVHVSGGTIHGALYGGNDRTGQVAQITNRVMTENNADRFASDGKTNLNCRNVKTYVLVDGKPEVGTVYGGGNGDYIYDMTDPNHIQYCGVTPDEPIQSNTFVDINIDGGTDQGHIGTVYGGGNGVTVINGITVLLNVKNPDYSNDDDHVGVIFGGNNKGSLTLIPDIILLKGKVNTVYGGCNKGAMYGDYTVSTSLSSTVDSTYRHVGSLVRLRNEYVAVTGTETVINPSTGNTTIQNTTYTLTPTARVTGSVYGGCRMNGVTNSSMVLVEGQNSDHINAELFGGSDISGVVGGTSMVVINGTNTTQVGNAYGGGNGHYVYQNNNVYELNDDGTTGDLIDQGTAQNPIQAPYCKESRIDMINGTCASGHNLYAGGYAALSGATQMNVVGGTVNDKIFGGGNLAGTTLTGYTFENVTYSGNGSSTVTVKGGQVNGGVFGGNNLDGNIYGAINVNILGGTFGTSSTSMTNGIFGGGYGNQTGTKDNVTVTITKASGDGAPAASTIYGDVYGGSALGNVNVRGKITKVNVLDGTINGDIYGGGLGQKSGYNGATGNIEAKVFGKVYVNIGDTTSTGQLVGNATIGGSVYGCNNVNGSPQDSVFVNIFKTAHSGTNYYPFNPPTGYNAWTIAALEVNELGDANNQPQTYALKAVYGGGNMAAYIPPIVSGEDPKCTVVHVYGCEENTIEDVYGGGNAADVGTTGTNGVAANTKVIIDGGRIHRMFGGGNGYGANNPGANIYGTARSEVYAGLIDQVYGGANQLGSIDVIDLNVFGSDEPNACDQVYGMVFGCANAAPLNHSITTTIGCPVGTIGQLYGGSFQAPIGEPNNPNANVTLNVYGGNYEYVFGGSKGKAAVGSDPGVSADIYGDVTLNLFGGTITNAFGGTDVKGIVRGKITVNVLDHESHCPLDITNIYGAGNLTAYTPYSESGVPTSPVVNVMHVKSTNEIHGNVYGGAYGADATVTSNPQVNIGYDAATMQTLYNSLLPDPAPTGYMGPDGIPSAHVHGNVYGGGELAAVVGTTTVNLLHQNASANQLYGGGHMVGATNTVVNVYNGAVVPVTNNNVVSAPGVYGGCDDDGTISGYTEVNILNNLGATGTDGYNVNVFGGGRGADTDTEGDVTVNFGGSGTTPILYGNVYGGSALGSVNANTDNLTKVWLKTGTIHGTVFGGGLGQLANSQASPEVPAIDAQVNGNIEVIGDGTDVNGWVFGANDQNGDPEGTVTVTINDGTINNVVGGGNVANYTAPSGSGSTILYSPYVLIAGGTVTDMVVGGGNMANIDGNTKVELTGGTIGSENHEAHIFGGGYGEGTEVSGNVLVNFGAIRFDSSGEQPVEVHTDNLKLFGDLYGGSALGDVNTNSSNTTTVNILNGTIVGAVYGGGLGQKEGVNGATSDIAATVNGDVQVNIGACNGSGCNDDTYDPDAAAGYTGMADLIQCDVYGCNNVNGSPQDAVRVDVYKTYHNTEQNNPNGPYAINQVFGGGNESDYDYTHHQPVHVRIHGCDNTIWRTFGGGNAAAVYGVVLVIEGGRFDFVFGGGNGESGVPANVVGGGIQTTLGGGTISQWVNGSNMNGNISGGITSQTLDYCGNATVEDYFLGSNLTDYHGDVDATIICDPTMPKYVNLYGGCNRAQFYGNISITIEGGIFYNVFGGSKGRLDDPTTDENEAFASNILDYDDGSHTPGTGGNITILVKGGHIGNLFGGCNLNGNVQGKIKIDVVRDDTNVECPLYLGNIYGGGNMTNYKPGYNKDGEFVNSYGYLTNPANPNFVNTPEINVKKGTVGGAQTVLIEDPTTQPPTYYEYEGNVYGGGKKGDVKAYPIVNIGDKDHPAYPVTIEGNVYGGGREGKVIGDTKVIIVPTDED